MKLALPPNRTPVNTASSPNSAWLNQTSPVKVAPVKSAAVTRQPIMLAGPSSAP